MPKYYIVNFKAFSFDTKEEAAAFGDKISDAFMAMPEAADYAASCTIEEDSDEEAPKTQMVCNACGGTDVLRDAYAEWDGTDWVHHSVYDNFTCETCGGETSLSEIPVL